MAAKKNSKARQNNLTVVKMACNSNLTIKPKRKLIRMVKVRLNVPSKILALKIRTKSLMRALLRSSSRERISSSSSWWSLHKAIIRQTVNRLSKMSCLLRMASSVRVSWREWATGSASLVTTWTSASEKSVTGVIGFALTLVRLLWTKKS